MGLLRPLVKISRFAEARGTSSIRRRVFSGPFRGKIEGINSTWNPQGGLKEHQDALPYQPVPPLKQTMERFLASVRPLLDDDKYNYAVKLAEDFVREGGQGEKLQEILKERAMEKENWLVDWFTKNNFLGNRDPVMVHVNATYTSPPMEQFSGEEGQIRCAALAIASVLKHKIQIDRQTLPIEKIGGAPQCMIPHYQILGCTRIPAESVDYVVNNHGNEANLLRHITVICKNNLFQVDVYDDNVDPLNVHQIEDQLRHVVDQSDTRATPVGILTNDNRDRWYKNYTELRKDPQNIESLDSIERSLFALSLDEAVPGYTMEKHFDIQLQADVAGGGSQLNSGNRWCDKTLQALVSI